MMKSRRANATDNHTSEGQRKENRSRKRKQEQEKGECLRDQEQEKEKENIRSYVEVTDNTVDRESKEDKGLKMSLKVLLALGGEAVTAVQQLPVFHPHQLGVLHEQPGGEGEEEKNRDKEGKEEVKEKQGNEWKEKKEKKEKKLNMQQYIERDTVP